MILLEQKVGKRQMKIQISLWEKLICVSFVGSDLFYFVPKFPEAVTGLYSGNFEESRSRHLAFGPRTKVARPLQRQTLRAWRFGPGLVHLR